jgi:hypothetical protein
MLARLIRSALLALTLAACSITSPADASRKGGFGFGFPHKTQVIVPQTAAAAGQRLRHALRRHRCSHGLDRLPAARRRAARLGQLTRAGGNDANELPDLRRHWRCATLDRRRYRLSTAPGTPPAII